MSQFFGEYWADNDVHNWHKIEPYIKSLRTAIDSIVIEEVDEDEDYEIDWANLFDSFARRQKKK